MSVGSCGVFEESGTGTDTTSKLSIPTESPICVDGKAVGQSDRGNLLDQVLHATE